MHFRIDKPPKKKTETTKYFNMFITLFFISFSFLQTACFLLNNIQQQKQYQNNQKIEFFLSKIHDTKKKQISNRKYCKTPGRTSSMHPSKKKKLTIYAQKLPWAPKLTSKLLLLLLLLNLNLNFEC